MQTGTRLSQGLGVGLILRCVSAVRVGWRKKPFFDHLLLVSLGLALTWLPLMSFYLRQWCNNCHVKKNCWKFSSSEKCLQREYFPCYRPALPPIIVNSLPVWDIWTQSLSVCPEDTFPWCSQGLNHCPTYVGLGRALCALPKILTSQWE